MPPKKRYSTSAAESSSSVPTVSGKAKTRGGESAKKKVERYEKAGKQRQEADNAANPDEEFLETPGGRDARIEEWNRTLALHLACEPEFHEYMKNPAPAKQIIFKEPWLASVHLRDRYNAHTTFLGYKGLWQRSKGAHALHVVHQATEFALSIVDIPQQKIEGTKVDLPDNDDETRKKREDLFCYHTTRHRLINLFKCLTDYEQVSSRQMTDEVILGHSSAREQLSKDLTGRFKRIKNAKLAVRARLDGNSRLKAKGIQILDFFLSQVGSDFVSGELYTLPTNDAIAKITQAQKQRFEDIPSADKLAAAIEELYDFTPEYYCGNKRGDETAFDIRVPTGQDSDVKEAQSGLLPLTRNPVLSVAEFAQVDQQSSDWIDKLAKEVKLDQFRLNYEQFDCQVTRPESLAKAKANSNVWASPAYRFYLILDNIYHIRKLTSIIFEKKLFVGPNNKTVDLSDVQQKLRRMFGLMAIMYGCVREGSLWLTVMDGLLEDLAKSIIGHVDPAFETVSMERHARILSGMQENDKLKLPSRASDKVIEKLHRESLARRLFAELALFYRGTVMLCFANVSLSKSWDSEPQNRLWYDEILKSCHRCGHPDCLEQLRVNVTVSGTKKKRYRGKAKVKDGGEKEEPENEGGEEQAEEEGKGKGKASEKPEAKREHLQYGLSVWVKDQRLGFRAARAEISDNRTWVYPCLWDLIFRTRYNAAWGPFFHYYAHLSHAACKPFRGKSGLVADINQVLQGVQ